MDIRSGHRTTDLLWSKFTRSQVNEDPFRYEDRLGV
jgi:hypothetical protein